MTDTQLDALAAQLAAGGSLEAALEALRSPGEQEMLKRCAAVHAFDPALFDLLRSARIDDVDPPDEAQPIDDVDLAGLVSAGLIELVPGQTDLYRVPAAQRAERYERWWTEDPTERVPKQLEKLTLEVLEHYEASGGDEVEALYHRLLVKPGEALKRFEILFDQCAAQFDVARCHDLVDVVTERLALLGPRGAAVLNESSRRLRAMEMWTRDWYRTARFMLPAESRRAVETLLRGHRGRTLVVWSGSGMGKTSHLRWLIARRCVPAGDACARVDFDEVDPLIAAREPWLVLLEAAAQLDPQLPGGPLHELLSQHAAQLDRLRGRPGASPVPASPQIADDIVNRFHAALHELNGDRRAVLVLDTLEEVLTLRGGGPETDLSGLLGMLATVARKAPAVRIVLASRYPLSERVVDFDAVLPRARELQIQPFSDKEARRYVTHYRGIADARMVASLVRGADGIPFKLELLCDTAEQRPDLDPAEVAKTAEADLTYVMQRIVRRLDERLQPLLHYGVAPRTLERSFLKEVVTPLVGDRLDERWQQLKRYAGSASWVMLDPVDADAVRFHVAVLDPMRELLGEDLQHDELQRRASEWFEQRARKDPARATRWLCEAVYHRFQFEGPQAERYWRRLLAEARAAGRPDRRRALAAEVLRDDYVDGAKPRRWRNKKTILRPRTLLRARWELAIAAVQLAHEDTPERSEVGWLEAEQAVNDLQHLRKDVKRAPFSEAELSLLHAGIRLGRGDLAGAEKHIARARQGHLQPEDRLWLWVAYADAASRHGREDSSARFGYALKVADGGRHPGADRAAVLLRLARHHAERDRIGRAIAACDEGLETAEGRSRSELELVRAGLELRSGAPTPALERVGASGNKTDQDPELAARRGIVGIRATLAAARPLDALALAEEVGGRYSATLQLGSAREQAVAAEGRELRGKVRASLLDVEGATRDFEEAANRWSRLGSPEGVCRCWVRSAACQLRGMRNPNQAEALLDQGRRTRAAVGQDAWTRCTLVGAELLARRGRPRRARVLVDNVVTALESQHRPPRAFVETALHGLAFGGAEQQERYLRLLCDHLARIAPATSRLAFLDALEHCPRLVGSRDGRRLRRLLPSPVTSPQLYTHVGRVDRALLVLLDAEVERVQGHTEDAARALDHAAALFEEGAPDAAAQRLLLAAVRAGHRSMMTRLGERELERAAAGSRTPVLDASVLLRLADSLEPSSLRTRAIAVAARIINEHAAAAGGWLPFMLELQAEDVEDHEGPDAASALWRQAAAAYEVLGDDPKSREIVSRHCPERAPVVVKVADDEIRTTLRLVPGELTVFVQRGATEEEHRRTGPRLISELARATPAVVGQATSPVVVKRLMQDTWGVGDELGSLLLDVLRPYAARDGSDRPIEAGLRTKDTALRALPWELAAPAMRTAGLDLFRRAPRTRGRAPDTRGLQGALNRVKAGELGLDGIFGRKTGEALRAFQAKSGLPVTGEADPVTVQRLHAAVTGERAPWVAIVRPSRRAEELTRRGSRQSGVPVDWVYQLHGFRTLVLDAASADSLKAALARRPVAIVHLNVGLVDHHGTAAVDLLPPPAAVGRPPVAGRLTGTAFEALLPDDLLQPLVVLDVPGPKTRREKVIQLLLRNAFVSDLAAVGSIPAVLGTGLSLHDGQQALYDALIGALSDGLPVQEVAERVRSVSRDDALTFPATALMARRPGIRFPAPGMPWT
jgi:cellulose synthase operon protein C